MLVTKSNDLRLNTGIDPTSHWTSEQWTLLVRRLEYSLQERSIFVQNYKYICRSKLRKAIMGFELSQEVPTTATKITRDGLFLDDLQTINHKPYA